MDFYGQKKTARGLAVFWVVHREIDSGRTQSCRQRLRICV